MVPHMGSLRRRPMPSFSLFATLIPAPFTSQQLTSFLCLPCLIFDRNLTWHKHISYLHTHCSKDLQFLGPVSHGRYGPDYSILRRLYETIILPKLEYGCFLYASAFNSNLLILHRIQYAATRLFSLWHSDARPHTISRLRRS